MTIGLVLAAAITAIGGVAVAIVNTKKKTPPSTDPAALDSDDWAFLRERVATCEARINDLAAAAEISDRRHDQTERVLDLDNPQWRHSGGRWQ